LLAPALRRALRIALWMLAAALGLSRFLWLAADFSNYSPWMIDQAKFTDEGWWANAAIMHALTGHWHVPGDYNPAVALPVWPLLLGALFHFTGASVIAARALSVAFSLATLAVVYLLVRRYAQNPTAAQAAVLLMAASPFAFAFSRLAILDTLVIFEFCAMLLVASCAANATNAGKQRIWPLVALALLIPAALLTKTTAAVLIPAVIWLAFRASANSPANGRGWRALIRAGVATAAAPLALLKLWALFVSRLGYGADYNYFFGVNAMPDIDWPQTLHWLHDLAQNGFWVDRLLYPLALVILLASVAFKRHLWRNPLFAASWMAIAGDAIFVFSRQDDYAPRYFLVMLAPVVFIVVLAFDDALGSSRRWAGVLAAAMAIAVAFNFVAIANHLSHRQYQLYGAARQIAATVRGDRSRSQLLFGVSAAEVGLIAGLPSINDAYGIDDMAAKVARYKPGWYLAWNGEVDTDALAGYALVPIAAYRIFDDDDRTTLTLYRVQGAETRERGTGSRE
jgi:4-amino-4-deoxy-L-arabinose transferase-like glycosyltransferase